VRVLGFALAAMAAVWPPSKLLRCVLVALAGAALVVATWPASFQGDRNQWALPVVVLTMVALWWAVPLVRRALPTPGVAWLLLAGCAAGVYACVPETDQLWEAGLALVAGAAAEVLLRRALPDAALTAAVALVLWAAVYGATGRTTALISGLFAFVPFVVVGLVGTARWGLASVAQWWTCLLAAGWLCAALVVARTGGVAPEASAGVVAVVLVTPTAAAFSAVLVCLARRPRSAG